MSSLRQIRSAVATVPPLREGTPAGLDLTGRQKHLLRETVTTLAPASGEVAILFYRRLLELDPSLRRSLKGSLKRQARQFMGLLKLAILSLDDADGLQPALDRLGTRRPRQRMAAGHCLTFSRALMWTFEQSLEKRFTREARGAWAPLLAEVSRIMADWGPPNSVYGRLWSAAI
jgi:hemoglobin-like flavoprotein